jgi:hypothetical protein
MAEKTVMEEMDAALADTLEMPTPETPEPETEPETPEPETPEPEPEAEETDEEAEARGAERDPVTGKFIKRGEEKPEPEKPAKVEPKKADPINDPIPRELKKETQDRIRTLIDTTKTITAERDTIKRDFDYMVGGVQATGATPAQYGETLSWLALFNSNDPKQQEKALELVESVADRLATLLGKERTINDPIGAHADLKEAVRTGKLTADYAKEIARIRNGQQFRSELTNNASQENLRQQQAAEEERQGRAALTELEKTLMASDPDYEAKKAILVPAIRPIMAGIRWSEKKDKFLEAYKNVRLPKAAPKKTIPTNQPLRAKQPAGGQTKAPGSMLEAIDGALAGMRK